ncbi:MAG: DMT family transporter [Burkholderiaceae bacterium]|jgi:drug/metabolite transporter (DMT)-like permease|nr:DMT family transporter [Burkholderiaceae bacterium]
MELGNGVMAAALGAALMNAGWNSAVKLGGDKMVTMALTTGLASLWSLGLLPWLDWRSVAVWDAAVWWWLAGSVAVHTLYHFVLPRAYQHGEFGVVYPVARGSAPLFVTLGAALLAGEWPAPLGLVGVLCLSLGVLALSARMGVASGFRGSGYALAAGAMIACYTVIDGLGARASGAALVYAALLTLGDGVATVLILAARRGASVLRADARTWRLCALAAAMQVSASWMATWALSQAPMGLVSALRESSVLFAGWIAAWLMRERLGRLRMLASALVFGGIVLVRWGS